MPQLTDDPGRIKKDGWRQGSILPASLVNELRCCNLLPERARSADVVVVVSHDCDVANSSFEDEPNVELLPLTVLPATEKDGARFWFKSPRRYQFEDKASDRGVLFAASIHDRVIVPRAVLLGHVPDENRRLEPENVKRLCAWIARRYTRAAFPDAFNERTRKATRTILKSLKSRGDLLSGIYILVSDEELGDDQDYQVHVWASMTADHFEDLRKRTDAQEALDAIAATLDGCDGIDVSAAELRSEADVSLHDIRLLKRWDFDSLSLRGGRVDDLPRDG